jgi:hypothetical protein
MENNILKTLFPALFEGNLDSFKHGAATIRKKNENCVLIEGSNPLNYLFWFAAIRDLPSSFFDDLRITYEYDCLEVSLKRNDTQTNRQ